MSPRRPLIACLAALGLAGSLLPAGAALPPRYDFTLDVLLEGPILTLDPPRVRNSAELNATGLLFEGLVDMSADGLRPGCALRWDVSRDSLEWRFHLDPARRFGDGTPLRSSGVLAAWARTRSVAPEWAWLFDGWTATAADSVTLRLVLERPRTRFAERLALPGAWVVREIDRAGTKSLSGTAPFRFAGRQPEGLVLAPRFDDPRGRPFAGRLLLRTPRPGSESRRLWPELHLAVGDRALFDRTPPGATTVASGRTAIWLLLVNPARPTLDAPARVALATAIDRKALAAATPETGLTARSEWPTGSGVATPVPLTAAGRVAGRRIVCDQGDAVAVALAEELAGQLGVSPAPMDPAAARAAVARGEYDLALIRWTPLAAGELGFAEFSARPEIARLNPTDGRLPAAPLDRLRHWQKVAVLLPLVQRTERWIRSDTLTGLEFDPLTGVMRLADAWPGEAATESKSP